MKKYLIIIAVLFILSFCGCSKNTETHKIMAETELKSSNEFYDCGISMNRRVFGDFIIDKDKVYFNALEIKKNGRGSLSHCVGNVFSNDLFQYIDLCFECNCEVFYTIKENISEENTLCILKTDFDEDKYIIEEYKGESITQNVMAIPRDMLSGEQIISYAVKNDGDVLVLTNKKLYHFAEEENTINYEVPEKSQLLKVFLIDNQPYCIVRKSTNKKIQIVRYNNDGKIDKSIDVHNGSAFTILDDEIAFYDETGIFKVDKELNSCEKVIDLKEMDKIWKDVIAVVKKSEKYGILYQSLSDQAYRTVVFENQKPQNKEKTEITIYDPSGDLYYYCSEEIINSFNETNPDYHISVMETDKELNYVLLSKEQPDLIVLSDRKANLLGMEGYLEDLTSYLDEDPTGFRDELINDLTKKISFDQKIFALPRRIDLETFCIRSSEVDNTPGWTTDDFLDWLIADTESLKDSWIKKPDLLQFCLEGTLEHYVDFNKNECYFSSNDFSRHMQKINKVTVYPPEKIMPLDAGKIRYIYYEGLYDIFSRKDFNDPWINKGFPTYDGKEKQILSYDAVSMLQTSKNKKGAFEFIKYFVRYRYGNQNGFRTDLPVLQKITEISQREYRQVEMNSDDYEPIGQDEIDTFWELYNISEVNDISHSDIMDIVSEEISQYFAGKKELEEVTDIIQRRVQLLLNERK